MNSVNHSNDKLNTGLEARLKGVLQSKSHKFDCGANEMIIYFKKDHDGNIYDVFLGILPVMSQ